MAWTLWLFQATPGGEGNLFWRGGAPSSGENHDREGSGVGLGGPEGAGGDRGSRSHLELPMAGCSWSEQ